MNSFRFIVTYHVSRITFYASRFAFSGFFVEDRLPSKKRYGVGLLGAGTVGGGLIRLLHEKLSHHQLPVEIKKVGVRNLSKTRSFNLPGALLSDNLEGIVEDKTIDILVEAMGGLEPARTYIEKALLAGKHVVTANKQVVSEYGDYLSQLAQSKGKQFLYEASVAGSIPIIEILREGVIPDRIQAIYGILNSTTNFILTRMTESGEDFHEALVKAQELGFAEPNPSFDISGKDAGQKLAILISILKHQPCHPAQLDARGIDGLAPFDFQFARERQWRIKPLAIYEEAGGKGFASVEPVLVPASSIFANVRNEYNALCFSCQNIGRQIFIGKGAGELPTASALLSDLSKITSSDGHEQLSYEPSGAAREGIQFCSSIENPRGYGFYIKCSLSSNAVKRRRIREVVGQVGEVFEESTTGQGTNAWFCVVTQKILHSELYRILNEILSFDADARLSWLRVLQETD